MEFESSDDICIDAFVDASVFFAMVTNLSRVVIGQKSPKSVNVVKINIATTFDSINNSFEIFSKHLWLLKYKLN